MSRPGPDDLHAAARLRAAALVVDLERDRADLAAANDAEGVAVYDDLIDAARRVLNNLAGPKPEDSTRDGDARPDH